MADNDFEGKIDAEGKLELYRSFWQRIRELIAAPEISKRLVEAVGKKKRRDWYDIRDYDLGVAREDELITDFPSDGDTVLVLECENQTEGETFIKFNSRNADPFDLVKYRKLRHNFHYLYLTNVSSPGKMLYVLFGRGDWDVERHYPEEEIMAINADTVDSLHASASAEANKLIALGSDAKLPDGVVRNIQGDLDANKPASPVVNDMFIARDTGKVYVCFTAEVWTDITTAASLSFSPAGNIIATDIQAAIEELDTEKLANIVEDTTPQLGGDLDVQTKRIYDIGLLDFKTPTELTIATGAITVTQSNHTIDTEADAASDDLDTINGGSDGRIVVLKAANDARTVVIKHNTGNIWLKGKADLSLDDLEDGIALIYAGTKWIDIGAGGISALSQLSIDADKNWAAKNITNLNTLTLVGAAPSPPIANRVYKDSIVKGWIQFNGTGTIAIQGSFNVSSIVDNGVGNYRINWDTDFADNDYAISVAQGTGANPAHNFYIVAIATGTCHVVTTSSSFAPVDASIICLIAIGDQ